jgi:hypothetical protein
MLPALGSRRKQTGGRQQGLPAPMLPCLPALPPCHPSPGAGRPGLRPVCGGSRACQTHREASQGATADGGGQAQVSTSPGAGAQSSLPPNDMLRRLPPGPLCSLPPA